MTRAWLWYQKAADAGEPDALARLGERADRAASFAKDNGSRASYWLESFRYYAAAADRARSEDWPDDAWRAWQYRRASLARLLACQGMMQQVAETYVAIGKQGG